MSRRLSLRNPFALFLLAGVVGCSTTAPSETNTRKVTGAVSAASLVGLDVPSVVAEDASGQTFDGPVASDGGFTLDLPVGQSYRLFITDQRASGRKSTESRVLWPGLLAWAQVNGTTSDGTSTDGASGPINVGTITPFRAAGAAAGGGAGVGGPANGSSSSATGTADGTPAGGGAGGAAGGATGNGASNSGGGHGGGGGGGGGSEGATDDGAVGGSHGGGNSGPGGGGGGTKGPSLCEPSHSTTSMCDGAPGGVGTGSATDAPLPPCTTGTGTGDGTAENAPAPPTGGPSCEKDKVAYYDSEKGRWDCVKMETPVTYFYSDKPIKARATVEFPRGVLTQWYPAAVDSYPMIAERDRLTAPGKDTKVCSATTDGIAAANGLLDWGTLDILGRNTDVDAKLPSADLERFTWSFARQVAANPVRTSAGQLEKFLFYRGVGNFSLPVQVTSRPGGKLALKNVVGDAIGPVFFLNVDDTKGVFTQAHAGIAKDATLGGAIPSLDGATEVEAYADNLARSVRSALDEGGLYDDESTAMVNTWKRQWFRTPGARLLYVAPQSWTDRSIPLTIDPKPQESKRVMVIRVEIITPELEANDVAALKKLNVPATAPEAKKHFADLGRFAEPRLRRAITLSGSPAWAQPLLAETVATNHTTHTPNATKALTPDPNGRAYPGTGFVVHEWGTDTIVVGSDGTQLLGLQHEEEDLPRFVYDRNR